MRLTLGRHKGQYMSEKSLPEAFDGTLDGLARIALQGFEAAEKDLQLFRAETEASFSRIELRLTEVPYRFELADLERRVGRIEGKIGSTPSAS